MEREQGMRSSQPACPRGWWSALVVPTPNQAAAARRDAAAGDPSQWARVLAGLEAVRQATRARGARIIVVIVSPAASPALPVAGAPGAPGPELPEERLAGILRQAGLERRWGAVLQVLHIS